MKHKILVIGALLCCGALTSAIAESEPPQIYLTIGFQKTQPVHIQDCKRFGPNVVLMKDKKKSGCAVKAEKQCNEIGGKVVRKQNIEPVCLVENKSLKRGDRKSQTKPADHAVPGIEGTDIGSGG